MLAPLVTRQSGISSPQDLLSYSILLPYSHTLFLMSFNIVHGRVELLGGIKVSSESESRNEGLAMISFLASDALTTTASE